VRLGPDKKIFQKSANKKWKKKAGDLFTIFSVDTS
jgi:hypothetical protein